MHLGTIRVTNQLDTLF